MQRCASERGAIPSLKWARGARAAVDAGTRVNAHAAHPVWESRMLFYVHHLPLLCACLHFRHPRIGEFAPNATFPLA